VPRVRSQSQDKGSGEKGDCVADRLHSRQTNGQGSALLAICPDKQVCCPQQLQQQHGHRCYLSRPITKPRDSVHFEVPENNPNRLSITYITVSNRIIAAAIKRGEDLLLAVFRLWTNNILMCFLSFYSIFVDKPFQSVALCNQEVSGFFFFFA